MNKITCSQKDPIISCNDEIGYNLQFPQLSQSLRNIENKKQLEKRQNQANYAKIEIPIKILQQNRGKKCTINRLQMNKKPKHVLKQEELNQLAKDLFLGQHTKIELQQKYDISKQTLERFIRQLTNEGQLTRYSKAKDTHIKPNSKIRRMESQLKIIIKENPKIIQRQIVRQLSKRLNISISQSSVSRTLQHLNFKKNGQTQKYIEVNKRFSSQYRKRYALQYRKARNDQILLGCISHSNARNRGKIKKHQRAQSSRIKKIKMEDSCKHDS